MFAYFNKFEIQMTRKQAESVYHSGDCYNDVIELLKNKKIKKQLSKISDEDLKNELSEYGAWDSKDMESRQENEERIIWIAGANIMDEMYNNSSEI